MISLFIITAAFSFLLILLVRKLFPRWGLLDNPKKYGHKRGAVPYPAGIIIPILFFSIAFAFITPEDGLYKPLIGFSVAAILLALVSFIDDRYGLPAWFRLVIHFIVAGIVIGGGIGIDVIRSPFGGIMPLEYGSFDIFGHTVMPLADVLAIFWIVGMINATNWLDGVSGLTSSIGAIASGILAVTAYMFGQGDVATLFGILTVICTVFFLFDLESPKILMGDSGSMFIGLSLAVFTIIAGGKIATLMIVAFVPIFDSIWTIGRRIYEGKSPAQGDMEHLHHNLLLLVKSRRNLVLLYAVCTLIFGYIALQLESFGKMILILILIALMSILEIYLYRKRAKTKS